MKIIVDTSILLHQTFEFSKTYDDPSYLFFNKIYKLQEVFDTSDITFAFDHFSPTWRHRKYPIYKGNRPPKTQEFINYKSFIEETIRRRKYAYAIAPGYESDDILASFTEWYPDEEIYIVTLDSDIFQLVSDRVSIVKPIKNGFSIVNNDQQTIGLNLPFDSVQNLKGIKPSQVIDFKALAGDKGDNLVVPIAKFGDVKVRELLNIYDNLDIMYDVLTLPNITFPHAKFKEDLLLHKDLIYLFRELVTLKKDVPKDYEFCV